MPDFRRGMAGIEKGQERPKGSGNFSPFCPEIIWTQDREEKFIAILNRVEDIPSIELHEFVPVGEGVSKSGKKYTKYEKFINRTDISIGESSDELTDRLGHQARFRTMAAAVELEPTYSTVNGRKRPTGFAVATKTITRNSDDGAEDVEIPLIGVITQSPRNFFGWIGSFNESTAPVEETPLQVIRRGKDASTAYDFTPYLDQPIDYTNLFDYVENVAYLRDEVEGIGNNGLEDAIAIGNALLEKRLDELADKERYDELVSQIEEIEDRFGSTTPKAESSPRVQRPERPSPRNGNGSSGGSNRLQFDELRRRHEAG